MAKLECLGTTGESGVTHSDPVALEYRFELCGWWCPVCRRLAVTDELRESLRGR